MYNGTGHIKDKIIFPECNNSTVTRKNVLMFGVKQILK